MSENEMLSNPNCNGIFHLIPVVRIGLIHARFH